MNSIKFGTLALLVGCTATEPDVSTGNAELGIAAFQIQDTTSKTTVIGLDAQQHEIARVDLVHGRFALTSIFKDDYPGLDQVDGRKLDVSVGGQTQLVWETMGYEPALHLPRHPDNAHDVAVLLADPHVKPILDRWGIGFDSSATASDVAEDQYEGGVMYGTNPTWCGSLGPQSYQCGTARDGLVINQCGGTGVANDAKRLTRTAGSYGYDEYLIGQCCPANTGGVSTPWFGKKACPTTGTAASTPSSSCGTVGANAACKACPGYPLANTGACQVNQVIGYDNLYYCSASSSDISTCESTWNFQECTPGSDPISLADTCHCVCWCVDYGYPWGGRVTCQ